MITHSIQSNNMHMDKKHNYLLFLFSLSTISLLGMTEAAAAAPPLLVKVGVVLDMNNHLGHMGLNCISMAVSDFYSSNPHYKTRLQIHPRDSVGDAVGAAAAAVELLKNVEVEAVIGPLTSMQANFIINLGAKAQVPIITFSATSPSLSSVPSPYFLRASLSDRHQAAAISALIKAFGWREVVPIHTSNAFGEGIVPFLTESLEESNAHVHYRSSIPPLARDDQIEAELYKLMTMQARVFVVHVLIEQAVRLFSKAKELGMMEESYVWIVTDSIGNELSSLDRSIVETMIGHYNKFAK